jgi:hypothetical protein
MLIGNVGWKLKTEFNCLGVKLAVVFLQIIANSYKEERNLIGINYKVSVFFGTALSTIVEKRQQRSSTAASLLAVNTLCSVTAAVCPQL